MFIYAIIAVDYFRDFGGGYAVNSYLTNQGNGVEGSYNTTVSAMTARGYTIGDEYYGTFTRSLYTLFQVLTGESWSEAIARPLVFGFPKEEGGAAFVAVFFTSFILLMQIVLINVVVAVLLENFVTDDPPPPLGSEDAALTLQSTTATALEVSGVALDVDPQRLSNLERQVGALDKKLDLILSILPKHSVELDANMAA